MFVGGTVLDLGTFITEKWRYEVEQIQIFERCYWEEGLDLFPGRFLE